MKTRVAGLVASAAALAMALAIVALPSAAQYENDGKAKAKGGKKGPTGPVTHKPIPRTPDGKPDLTGTWQSGGVSITGEDGAPPLHPLPPIDQHTIARQPLTYKPEFEAKRKGLTTLDDPTLYCLLPGVPRIQTNPMPLEILETPKEIAILYEAFRVWRRIPLNDKLEHPDDLTPTWMGDSVRPLGRRHPGGRLHWVQRQNVDRRQRFHPYRTDARGGALHVERRRQHDLGSGG